MERAAVRRIASGRAAAPARDAAGASRGAPIPGRGVSGSGASAPGLPPVELPERVHRDRAVLLWQARGSSDCAFGGAPEPIAAGHALWIPPGAPHTLRVHADSVVLPLHLRARPSPGALAEPTWIAVDRELRTLILALLQSQTSIIKPEVDLERRILRLLQARAVPPTGLPMPVTPAARAIAERLRARPADDAPVAALARAQHVSARTVERAFLAETGMTLRDWRGKRRMEVSGALLRGRGSLSAVAGSVGYQSPSAFRRAFKAHFGMTPTEYARRFGDPA